MLLPFGCCLQAEVVHCVLDEPGFAAVTVQPIVHAVEHALQILAIEFVHVPGKRRQAALSIFVFVSYSICGNVGVHALAEYTVFFLLAFGSMVDLSKIREMSPKLLCSTSDRVTAMLGMGAPPNARNFFRLWMASSVPFFSTGSFEEKLTTSDASATLFLKVEPMRCCLSH